MTDGAGDVLESYSKEKPQKASLIPGRFLYCVTCDGFTRHSIFMDAAEKVVACWRCRREQARLVKWRQKDWIDRRYIDNIALTVMTVLGEDYVCSLFAEEGSDA